MPHMLSLILSLFPEEGPVEDVPIGNEFSHVNNRPLTIDDFELLKVFNVAPRLLTHLLS